MTRQDFYKDLKREQSREIDFGVWWHGNANYPTYRVTWVQDTGEVISVNNREDYQVIGVIELEEDVERVLEGWVVQCGQLNSLQWVYDQIKGFDPILRT